MMEGLWQTDQSCSKYLNPNLALLLREGLSSFSKIFIAVQVMDLVIVNVLLLL